MKAAKQQEDSARDGAFVPGKLASLVVDGGESAMAAFPAPNNQPPEPDQDEDVINDTGDPAGEGQLERQAEPSRSSRQNFISGSGTEQEREDRRHTTDGEDEEAEEGARTPKFRPIVDTVKGRFSNAHSSVLLPRRIGQAMDLSSHPRFHAYGWNLNIRLEPAAFVAPAVCRLLTFQDLSLYSRVFFEVVDPIYHFIDQKKFLNQCAQYWTAPERGGVEDIEAVVSGVVALGSFFSVNPSSVESSLVEHGKQVLDIGCAYAPGRVSLNQVAGWILRTLYLRLTTRPLLSWYSSCSTMHLAEATGLHVNLQDVDIVTRELLPAVPDCTSSRSDTFECAVFLNLLIAAEYGRTRVTLQDATEPNARSTSKLTRLSAIMVQIESTLNPEERLMALSSLQRLPQEPSIFALLRSDVTIHLFRKHLHPYQGKINPQEQKILLSIIKDGIAAAKDSLPPAKPWWNILSTPFQSLMVLLAVDTTESLSMVEDTLSTLGLIYNTFPSHLAGEVLQTSQTLVQGLQKRKILQAKMLGKPFGDALAAVDTPQYPNSSAGPDQIINQAEALFDDWLFGDLGWNRPASGEAFAQHGDSHVDAFNFA
ncbi:hypothetical protein H2200_005210 [Cladophialophora chaetospira]|uniref:Transcription factor domain-containing protein n=1 Tax=Cladophialophora chaetospira TaxID=386627 RepID=A0AA38XBJ5_9EURO|nr:hypothetical protein H2200_005210 [Cladophialophora chaetospira]